MPEIQVDIRHRLASVGVDHLDVQVKWHTGLTIDDVLADKFAGDICIR